MQSCVNCSEDAVFHIDDPGANPIDYCRGCLPSFLHARANAGHFKDAQIVHGHKPDPNAPPKKRTRKKS